MLENFDTIDWPKLTHAYGQATDIPEMLRELASPIRNERENALDGLRNTLCHQSCTVYEATAPAVPFLLELLASDAVKGRAGILRLLADIVTTIGYLEAHGAYDSPIERSTAEYREALRREGQWR